MAILEGNRMKGSEHCVPFAPCPICAEDIDLVLAEGRMAWLIECPECGLIFGLPNGYSSRLGMVEDWNQRPSPNEAEPSDGGTPPPGLFSALATKSAQRDLSSAMRDGFKIEFMDHPDYVTDEYKRTNVWAVSRWKRPFCDAGGIRVWTGKTPEVALKRATDALGMLGPEQRSLACAQASRAEPGDAP